MKFRLQLFLFKSYNIFQLCILGNMKFIEKTNMPKHIQETNQFIMLKHNNSRIMCMLCLGDKFSSFFENVVLFFCFEGGVLVACVLLISDCAEPFATISV